MLVYRIRSWEKFQHFKDRRPPWIKLYRDVLDDMEWHELDPAASKVLVMLWLIASEDDGKLPDSKKLAFRLRMSEKDIISAISQLSHWVEQVDITCDIADGNSPISERYQDDRLETERETETEERQSDTAKPKRTRKTALPENFEISDRVREWANEKGHERLDEHLDAFKRKATMKGYTYVDWDLAFMEAIRENWAKLQPKVNGDTGYCNPNDKRYVN
jgi:hypothetical protein